MIRGDVREQVWAFVGDSVSDMFGRKNAMMVTADMALPGRTDQTMPVPAEHFELGTPLVGPWPEGYETLVVGMGCFWGAERKFWQADGVHSTNVGYAGGFTPNPSYEEVCSGFTGHTEVVMVVWDPSKTNLENMLRVFWENHDPTQGMRQGNDIDRKSTRLNSSHSQQSRMPSSA